MDQALRLYLLYSDKYVISKIFVVYSVIFDHDNNLHKTTQRKTFYLFSLIIEILFCKTNSCLTAMWRLG